jgi:glycine hydroxymethyltransferase
VKRNAVALSEALQRRGHCVVTNGTENHLILWDLRPHGLTGSKLEKLLERGGISVNKNTLHGDKSAAAPGGVRLGTPAMTTRGLKEDHFEVVADMLDRALRLALQVQQGTGKKLVDFEAALEGRPELEALRRDVEAFSSRFDFPSSPPAELGSTL